MNLIFAYFTILVICITPSLQQNRNVTKRLDITSLNPKVVGLILKANGKRYFVSSELCPGGVFLTRPVNENCLCYNGIFEMVRSCCSSASTQITTDSLEWRMDYKCGTSPEPEGLGTGNPLRAILPFSKPRNRFGSTVSIRSFTGPNTKQWRKYDTEDIIVRNDGILDLHGKVQFEIVNLKPLGREIKIMLGKSSETAICFSGWLTEHGHQSLRVRLTGTGATEGKDCCLRILQENSPGQISTNCSQAVITTEIVDVQSADMDIGQCDQDTADDSQQQQQHTLKKREQPRIETIHFRRVPNGPTYSFNRELPLVTSESLDQQDFIGDKGVGGIIVKKRESVSSNINQQTSSEEDESLLSLTPLEPSSYGNEQGISARQNNTIVPHPTVVILPRKRGISRATLKEQALAINEFVAIIRNDLTAEIRQPQTYKFHLLKKSFDIFLKVVPTSAIPHVMVKTAFDVFYFLYEELDPMMDAEPIMYKKAMGFLDNCLKSEQEMSFKTYGCPPEVDSLILDEAAMTKLRAFSNGQDSELQEIIKSLKYLSIKKDMRFIPERHDVYVEINWKVVDFVHSFCLEHFAPEFNAHHFYESELEKLFLFPEVQRRWFARRNDLRYVKGIFPVSDMKMKMKQLDKVTAIGHYLSRYNGSYWLYRPSFQSSQMHGNSDNSDISGVRQQKRLIFAQNMMDEEDFRIGKTNKIAGGYGRAITSKERELIYPFQFPEKIPAGEVIWDGLAVCLHAGYSSRKSYFTDANLWGVYPSLLDLGKLYP